MAFRIGVIGTGAMGGAIAAHLLELGHEVHIRDIDPAREAPLCALGAIAHPTPRDLATAADFILIVVVDSSQIKSVLSDESSGLLPVLGPRHLVLMCSTISPDDAIAFASSINARGSDVIDGPISGGPARARNGTMSMMLGASDAALERARSLLQALSDRRFHISAQPGDGTRAKLVNNLAAGINLAAAAEALALARRFGLDPKAIAPLMSASSGQSWAADDRVPRALAGDLEPRARLPVLTKDMRLANEAGDALGAELSVGHAALAYFQSACDAGLSADDDAVLVRFLLDRASN